MIADRVGSFTLFSKKKKIEYTLAFSRSHNLRFVSTNQCLCMYPFYFFLLLSSS